MSWLDRFPKNPGGLAQNRSMKRIQVVDLAKDPDELGNFWQIPLRSLKGIVVWAVCGDWLGVYSVALYRLRIMLIKKSGVTVYLPESVLLFIGTNH